MRGHELWRGELLCLRHALPKADCPLGVVAALGHHQEAEEVGFRFHLTGAGALNGVIEGELGDLGGCVEGPAEKANKEDDVDLLAYLFT